MQPTGAAIGLVEDFEIASKTLTLEKDDIFLLYTDGVTEAINPQLEESGQDRLAAFVRQASGSSAQELVGGLWRSLREFTNGQPLADDTTIVACRFSR